VSRTGLAIPFMVEFGGMFLYIPYGTDAPIYVRPVVTMVMIGLNVVVFFMVPQVEPFMLALGTGSGLHPLQWLTSNFFHNDIFHLIFNMLFLWVFGPIVEGRMGPLRMLVLYLGMAVLGGAIFQILTLTLGCNPNFGLGTSGVILGLAAMSFIWAPESKVHALMVVLIILVLRVKDTETDIKLIIVFFAIVQILASLLFGNGLSGELGHLVGITLGLAVAVAMLKWNLVDCESQDIFSVYSGEKDRAEMEEKKTAFERLKEIDELRQKRQSLLDEEIELAIQNQTPLPAFVIAQRKEQEYVGWTLPQELHLKMIQQLLAGKHWTEATTSMQQYLVRHQEQALFVGMMLAQAFLSQNKPESAVKVLDDMLLHESEAVQQSAILKIRAKADVMHQKNLDEGVLELDG
jgi:membrane associated rhomboid family serine protease